MIIGLFLRLWHNEFGLPHSFYADEPEIVEFAIKYTYELRDVVKNNNWYKFIPISYVYGTFPAYLFTICTVFFSKLNGLLNISFAKMDIYIFLRTITAMVSLLLVPAIFSISKKLFNSTNAAFLSVFLIVFNWKLIVHSHYVNADIIVTVLLLLSFATFYKYYTHKPDNLFTVLSGILFGLAVGTKITAFITYPLYVYVFLKRKDLRGLCGFSLLIFGAFAFTNPFSLIFANDFAFRIYSMFFKEAGMVFDSVDRNPLKYINALGYIATIPVLLYSLYGKVISLRGKRDKTFHHFLIGHVLFYILFYSIQQRRVDRWVLPILPIILIYASYGITKYKDKVFAGTLLVATLGWYLFFPAMLLFQFKRHTPKSEAYLWMREHTDPADNKLIYTEEGLDPMNKLLGERVVRVNVYENENAQFDLPDSPEGYHYVIVSSRPMSNYKREEVRKKFGFYSERWGDFEMQLRDTSKFELLKKFTLPKPNLIPLSDVYIYKNLAL